MHESLFEQYIRGVESGEKGEGEICTELLMLLPTCVWIHHFWVVSLDRMASSALCPPAPMRPHPRTITFGMKLSDCKWS